MPSSAPTVPRSPHAASWFELDSDALAELDETARTLAVATTTPTVLITLVGRHGQYFLGATGVPEDIALARMFGGRTMCHHMVESGGPLTVQDAHADARFGDVILAKLGFVRAYAGVPVRVGERIVGSVCASDATPRALDDRALAAMAVAAQLAGTMLATRGRPRAEPERSVGELGVAVGDLLEGKYMVTAPLGRGGQGEVLLARDTLLGRIVAIKLVHSAAREDALVGEGATLAAIRHPGIVRVHGWGRSPSGRLFLVLDHLRGSLLSERMRAPLPADHALRIVAELGEALDALHGHGFVHGDVKPDNVILEAPHDRAVLFDFGLALRVGSPRATLGGTPGFSAPEQFVDAEITAAADVYALAVVAAFLLAGAPPFDGETDARLDAQRGGTPALAALPTAIAGCLRAALDPDPARRPSSVRAFVAELQRAI